MRGARGDTAALPSVRAHHLGGFVQVDQHVAERGSESKVEHVVGHLRGWLGRSERAHVSTDEQHGLGQRHRVHNHDSGGHEHKPSP